MSAAGTVNSQLALKIAGAAGLLGAEVAGLLEAAGIPPDVLHDPDARVPAERIHALFDEAARRTGLAMFGVRVAEIARQRPDNVLAVAVRNSATLGDALRRAARYAHIVHDMLELRIGIEGPECQVSHHARPGAGTNRHGVECSLAMLFLLGREMLGTAFRLTGLRLRHARPACAEELARFFETEARFEQPSDAIVFDAALLGRPLPGASERVARHIDRLLEDLLSSLPRRGVLTERVRAALAAELDAAPTIDRVAARLGTTSRSLQRRLQSEGVSYQALLDELRHELALQYLDRRELPLAEVSFLLGFAEQSAFQRAFRRWRATTPAEWRRRQRQGQRQGASPPR
jgi:AraC-like DNA-binding protein